MQLKPTNNAEHFLSGGGEMGALIRAKDWSKTTLGDSGKWPHSLLTTLSILLSSKFPMFLWWGPELIQFYNDSYRPSLGDNGKHPTALGQNAFDCWPEIWPVIKPLIDQVLAGGNSVWFEDQLIPIFRNGKLEDVYWTFSYSAVRDESGKINGVLVVCTETTDKVQNLKKLESSEQKFRDTVKQAPVAISILKGPEFMVESANEKMLELWGKTSEQVLDKKLFDGIPEASNQGFEEILRNVFTTGERYVGNDAPVRLARPSGTQLVYVNFIYEPLRESDGSICGVTAVAIDVTKQVGAKNALTQSESKFRTLINQSPIAMAILKGKNYVIDTANEVMLKTIWRKELHEVQNKSIYDVFPELLNQRFPTLLDSVLNTGKSERESETHAYVNSHDGRKDFFLDFEYAPLKEPNGDVSGIFVTVSDVTLRVKKLQKINDAAERLVMATEGTQLATWDLNLTTRSIVYSPRLAVIFGHEATAVLSHQQLRDQILSDDVHRVDEAFDKALETGIYYYEARVVHPNNSVHWIRTQGKVIYENEVPSRMLGTLMDITEQQEIEQKIARLASIVETSDDAIISKRLDGIITSWNDSARRIFGHTAEEMIGQSIAKIIPDDRMDEERDIIARLRRGERVDHFETKRITKDKQLIDISLSISPIKDAQGNVIGSSKIARDISKQKQAEKLLNESRQHLQVVIDASELGAWELVLKDKAFTYSRRYLEILGYKEDRGYTHAMFSKHLHPEDLHIRENAFKAAFETGILNYSTRIIWNDGSIHWAEMRGKVFYDEQGMPIKLVGTARDITDERSYRQVLEESEQKFRLLADSMPQFVWIANDAGMLHYFNQSVYHYTGLTPAHIDEHGWLQIVHSDDCQENIRLWTHSVKSGEPFSIEHRLLRSDGMYRWHLSRAVPQKDSADKIQMWVGTSTDIHDRKIFTTELENEVQLRTKELKQLNEDLIKSNGELAQFAYVASHDLQEPLRKIQTFSTRLLESESQNLSDKGKDYFRRMQLASKRMQQLILDLLSYSRASTAEKHFEKINLTHILHIVKEQVKEALEQKHGIIKSTPLPTLHVIPYQFEQLLTNIITNAIKFSKKDEPPLIEIQADIVEGTKIKSLMTSAPLYHRITIADHGIGFDAQFSERIFQVFQRLHGKDEFPGTGIGLAIVKKIVENHNGMITAFGEINKGALFTIYLPVTE